MSGWISHDRAGNRLECCAPTEGRRGFYSGITRREGMTHDAADA